MGGGLGGYNPAPFQFGGAGATDLEAIQRAISEAEGTAIAGPLKDLEDHATARVLWDLYMAVQRFSNQAIPEKMGLTALERWEGILGRIPASLLDLVERRARVAAKLALISKGNNIQVLNDYLTEVMGESYVGLEFSDPLIATSYVPGGGVIPGGPTLLDGDSLPDYMSPYNSSVGHFIVVLQKPDNITDEEFYIRAGMIFEEIDNLTGAWMTFDWVRDGPNGAGFFLDEDSNLDNQRFDS